MGGLECTVLSAELWTIDTYTRQFQLQPVTSAQSAEKTVGMFRISCTFLWFPGFTYTNSGLLTPLHVVSTAVWCVEASVKHFFFPVSNSNQDGLSQDPSHTHVLDCKWLEEFLAVHSPTIGLPVFPLASSLGWRPALFSPVLQLEVYVYVGRKLSKTNFFHELCIVVFIKLVPSVTRILNTIDAIC